MSGCGAASARTGTRARWVLCCLLLLVVGASCGSGGPGGSPAGARPGPAGPMETITVAAAADLRLAFTELAERFADRGLDVKLTFGSSGLLARQVVEGAPFDAFSSADLRRVDEVIDAGRGDPRTRAVYAVGRLVVYTRRGLPAVGSLDDLTRPDVSRVAIANPEHAPYGVAAEQALASAGLLETLRPKLVLGDNVSATLQLAATGNADAAIVARSLVGRADRDRWRMVPARLHRPIRQGLVVTATDDRRRRAAQRFVDAVLGPEGQRVLRRYGFEPPGGHRGR